MPRTRILSLDGGGIRGVLSASFLAYVEAQLQQPLISCFDLVTGTSTGAIIALALSTGMPAKEVLAAYKEAGPLIFPKPKSLGSRLWGPGHDNQPLRTWLVKVFGERTLGHAKVKVAIPTIDLATGRVRVWKTDHHGDLHGGGDRRMWEVAMASAAAPTFLPAVQVDGKGAYVDGGLWANNPAMVGLVEAVRYAGASLEEVRILSVGTGRRHKTLRFEEVKLWGALRWVRNLTELVFAAQSSATHNQVELLLGRTRYLRVDPDLTRTIALDDVREMVELEHIGETAGMQSWNDVKRLLLETGPDSARAHGGTASSARPAPKEEPSS